MEDNTNKITFLERSSNLIKEKKKFIIFFFLSLFILLIGLNILSIHKDRKNKEISEQYIQAGLFLERNDFQKSEKILKEIIFSKNKFYSILALNTIIEKNLVKNVEEVLELFEVVEKNNNEKEQKNLIKLKKALYLMKSSNNDAKAQKLLKEIIEDKSSLSSLAIEISKK